MTGPDAPTIAILGAGEIGSALAAVFADTGATVWVADPNPADHDQAIGVRVVAVETGSASEAAGLSEGDLVTAIAGRKVRKASDATAAIQLQRPGDQVALQVLRDGARETLTLELPP